MRLIDADALKKLWCEDCDNKHFCNEEIYCDSVKQLYEQPTVDAVESVRCKDCKYYLNSTETCGLIDTRLHFYETDKVWTADCFCAWGDKKDV